MERLQTERQIASQGAAAGAIVPFSLVSSSQLLKSLFHNVEGFVFLGKCETHETATETRRGSGLGVRVELARATWLGDAATRVVADPAGWRWSSELRAGARATLLARRLELAALAFAGADVGDAPSWLGAGVTGRIGVRPVRAVEASFEFGLAPVALRTRDDAMDLPKKLVSRIGAGWQYAPAWRVHLQYDHEVLRGGVAMQLAFALIYRP